ncbi:MAG TPA: cystathionine gamma-synthase [Gammaproteobacteria bacterium]|nr:cystathionine gamma-synthase [Gammaproteobacteria bacterium]
MSRFQSTCSPTAADEPATVADPGARCSGGHRPATVAVRAGIDSDAQHGAVVPPICLSSTFNFAGFGAPRRYDYTRSGNPTRTLLAEAIARLEGSEYGLVTATGMAAITTVLQLLEPDDLLLAPYDCYGGCWRLLTALARKGCFKLQLIDFAHAESLHMALSRKPRMVWIETPSNPLLRITDIRNVATAAHQHDALVVVDNTFLSPALQQPLAMGADIVVHSTTKYLNGHSDVVGGAIVSRTAELHQEIEWWSNCLGVTGAPFDSYLTLRGLRTLTVRMRMHEDNALHLAELLREHPAVARVHYPGLPDHPDHAVAARQQSGFGAMLSFELLGGEPAVRAFLDGLSCISLAESLGGVESLIAHPATMTHAAMAPEARRAAGIRDTLLRLSVGIEHRDDLAADVRAALARAAEAVAVKESA